MSTYTLTSGCMLRSMGSRYLFTVFPPSEPPYALEVNESFARLVSLAKARGTFSEEDLVSMLRTDYGLDDEPAREEVRQTLDLWKEYGLL